jgi:hypothetical protein
MHKVHGRNKESEMTTSDTIKDICGSVNPSKVDKNEAPEGFYAVSGVACAPCAFNCKSFCTYEEKYGKRPNCSSDRRLDACHVHFIKKESERNMEEYEYCKAGTHEEWCTIVDAIFRGDCEIKRTLVRVIPDKGKFACSVVWDRATHIENGREYRWKKPAPPKVKKLVDRTAEELTPLIGYIARKKRDGLYFMITSNQVFDQENMEIAPLGSEDFLPMQKEIEVEE